MKNASPAFQAALLAGPAMIVDLLTITLTDGTIFRFNFSDRDVQYFGNTYSSAIGVQGPWLQRGTISQTRGTQANKLTFTIATTSAAVSDGGLALLDAIIAGLFNGATIELDRAINPTVLNDGITLSVNEAPQVFLGIVTETKTGRLKSQFTAQDPRWLLNTRFPIDVYQPSCRWTLFSPGCTLNAAAYQVTTTVQNGPNTKSLVLLPAITIPAGVPNGGTVAPSGYFSQGIIKFLSGQNAPLSRSIQTYYGQGNAASYEQVVLDDQPEVFYYLNESAGSGIVTDYSGNNYTGTVIGGLSFGAGGALPDGKTAAKFDGSTSYINCPMPNPNVTPGGGAVSFEFWMQLNAGATIQPMGIFDTAPNVANRGANWSSFLRNGSNNPGFDWWFSNPFMPIPNNSDIWQHVVVVFRAQRTIDLMINGVLVDSIQGSSSGGLAWRNPFPIGRTAIPQGEGGGYGYYDAFLQMFAIYPYALSADQALNHYQASQIVPFQYVGQAILANDLPYVPLPSDIILLQPGCDKTTRTCSLRYNNIINNGSMPFAPVPEQSV